MYVVQNIMHSIVALLIVECALISWRIRAPHIKQWFRMLVIFLPLMSFPIYQLASPHRGDVYFRLNSLLDSNRWLFLDVWGGISILFIFISLLLLTCLIFLIQELIPLISDMLRKKHESEEEIIQEADTEAEGKIANALNHLPISRDFIDIIRVDDLVLFSSTGLNPKIYVSTGLINTFNAEHLNVAFAHEIAHIKRSRRPVLIIAYLFRIIMFFNPVAMFEFRRLAQEEENVCDNIAVMMTGKPDILIEAVQMLRPSNEDVTSESKGIDGIISRVENYSHDIQLKNRIEKISTYNQQDSGWWAIPFILTAAFIVLINYYIV
jgi:Zn-dependent protease with chaperone function